MDNEGKIVKSYSLAQDVIDEIERVRKEKKLKSSSAALERIILSKQIDMDSIRGIVYQMVSQIMAERGMNNDMDKELKPEEKKVLDEIEAATLASMDDIWNSMPKE